MIAAANKEQPMSPVDVRPGDFFSSVFQMLTGGGGEKDRQNDDHNYNSTTSEETSLSDISVSEVSDSDSVFSDESGSKALDMIDNWIDELLPDPAKKKERERDMYLLAPPKTPAVTKAVHPQHSSPNAVRDIFSDEEFQQVQAKVQGHANLMPLVQPPSSSVDKSTKKAVSIDETASTAHPSSEESSNNTNNQHDPSINSDQSISTIHSSLGDEPKKKKKLWVQIRALGCLGYLTRSNKSHRSTTASESASTATHSSQLADDEQGIDEEDERVCVIEDGIKKIFVHWHPPQYCQVCSHPKTGYVLEAELANDVDVEFIVRDEDFVLQDYDENLAGLILHDEKSAADDSLRYANGVPKVIYIHCNRKECGFSGNVSVVSGGWAKHDKGSQYLNDTDSEANKTTMVSL